MNEINYQVFDEVSGIGFESYSDKFVKEEAARSNKTCSEVFDELKESILKEGVKYFIAEDSNKIKPMLKPLMVTALGEYYDTFEDAVNALFIDQIELDLEIYEYDELDDNRYFIPLGKKEILTMPMGVAVKCIGTYYDTIQEAETALAIEKGEEVKKDGKRYFVPLNKKEIKTIPRGLATKCAGTYYDSYEEAEEAIKDD